MSFYKYSIEWIDASGSDPAAQQWVTLDQIEKMITLPPINSCGFLVKESEDFLVLAGTWSKSNDETLPDAFAHIMIIPRRNVLSITKIEKVET